jgi:hypothetical protein
VWLSFLLGIAVSLAANIAAAPSLAWQSVLVAGWPPVALLLAAELLTHHPQPREHTETEPAASQQKPHRETSNETGNQTKPAVVSKEVCEPAKPPAEHVMWEHFRREQARGRTPSGAELDRVAGTNNYGRTVLRRWREQGRIPPADPARRNGHPVPGPRGAP